ncbi:MAG: molybdopterin cofactor-binding domain-containing protein [Sphingomonadaceae bacterium]
MRISRRGILAGAAAGGGLLVAWGLLPRSYDPPLAPGRGESIFGAWLKIGQDGVVTVAVPQLEMGQGITTLLPQIIAVELGADWRQVAVEPAPVSGAYANVPLAAKWAPLWMPFVPSLAMEPDNLIARRYAEATRFTATADGMSLPAYEADCREAAATARAMLCMAAAEQWGTGWEECTVQDGFVAWQDKRLNFAALAEQAASQTPPSTPPLRPEPARELPMSGDVGSDESLPQTAFPRLDLPAKVDGSILFAGDVRLPDMVYAAIRHGPLNKAELSGFDEEAGLKQPGIVSIVQGHRWLAAVATNWWAAERALDAMQAVFKTSANVDSQTIEERLDTAVRTGEAYRLAVRGEGYDNALKPDIALRYDVAPAFHATLETASVTARYNSGKLELWIASQAPGKVCAVTANALGISVSDVILYPLSAGGSFDRDLEHDHAVEAALIAREAGRPVQLIWSRWQEVQAGKPRAPVSALLTARLAEGGNGQITAMRTRIAMPATALEFGERLFNDALPWEAVHDSAGKGDDMAVEGAMPPYAIPDIAIDHVPVDIDLPTGRLRGNAHGYTAFFTESFLDEIASREGREPLSYRVELLGNDVRMVECLQQAAHMSNWGGGQDRSGQGLACHRIGPADSGGRIACIATARQDAGGVRVTSLSAAVDIGRIVNLDIARQQIEGGLVFGMGLALGCSTSWRAGVPATGSLRDFSLPSLADCPEISVHFMTSDAVPFDPGELGVAVVAPAIANALYSATGLRLRRLPLLSDGL